MAQARTCPKCGTPLADLDESAGVWSPCPRCGSNVVGAPVMGGRAYMPSPTLNASSGNNPTTRRASLEREYANIGTAVKAGDSAWAQDAVKSALEAIHELDDGRRKRGEWSWAGWTSDEQGLWQTHIGARNASHHSSSGVVTLRVDGNGASLLWDIAPQTIAGLHFPDHATQYRQRLAGRPVLPALGDVVALVTSAVS